MSKTAIVTGSSKGIGREIAIRLALNGYNTVVHFARDVEGANEVIRTITGSGGTAMAIQEDLQRFGCAERIFDRTISSYGGVDVLINNAGVMITKPIAQVTEEDFDRQMTTNVKGSFFLLKEAMLKMNDGGSIVNISTSVTGQMFPGYSVYAGTKGALEQFTRQLAKEFGTRGISINAIAPGPTGTDLFFEGKSEELINQLSSMNAFKRLGTPEDIAGAVEMLLDERSRWITGQTIRANGGFI